MVTLTIHSGKEREAYVQIVKYQSSQRLQAVEIRYAHGSKKRIEQALARLGYHVPNTSAIERRNDAARLMSAAQIRKILAFAGKESTKDDLGWWASPFTIGVARSEASSRRYLSPWVKKYEQRSPAMAIGLANLILSIREILLTPVYPPKGPKGWR